MELDKYYSLDEVLDRDIIIGTLKKLKRDGKIDFKLESDNIEYFFIEEIDIEDHELEDLLNLFDENDVYPYYDKDSDEGLDDDYLDQWDDDSY
jgi:hypothetical protein